MFTSRKDFFTIGLLPFVMLQITSQSQGQFVPESRCLDTCRVFQDDKFNNYCPREGSCDWQCAAQRMNCPGQYEYHCARENGHPDLRFVNVCAIPQQCRIGEEPAISFTKNAKLVTNTQANCIPCVDKHFYNDRNNRMSSTFSQCSDKKWNPCTKENHKIDCGPERGKQAWDVQTEGDGFCRCDARGGYEPKFKDVLDEGEYCFDQKVECVKKDCGPGMELSLNYKCIPKCAEGLVRTQLSDICSQIEILTSSSPSTPVSVIPTSTNRTESVTMSPNPPSSTLGPSPVGVDKYVVAGAVTVALVCLLLIIAGIGYIVYRRRNKKYINKHEYTTIYQGDHVEIQNEGGKVNIRKYGDDKMTVLAKKTGTACNERLEVDTDSFPSARRSSSVPDFPDNGSSSGFLESCNSAAGTLPLPPKDGPDLRPGAQTDVRETVVCHPSDADDTLLENFSVSKHVEEIKPADFTERLETDEDDGFIDEVNVDGGSLSDEDMEKLAEELLNTLNGYLKIFAALNETNTATIKSNLKKIAAENKVNLDNMLNFRMCVEKPSKRFKDIFKCKNCGMKFIRGNSSGDNNSSMYQSISQLLCGDESLQNRLRLRSTLHAVKHFKDYVKQSEAITSNEPSPYNRVLEIFARAGIDTSGIQDWKLCLREGIRKLVVKTSESTRDSSQVHIMFLSHALQCKITQHFEDSSHHNDTEDCPVLEGYTANTSDILDLHILWNEECNHLMPLFQVST